MKSSAIKAKYNVHTGNYSVTINGSIHILNSTEFSTLYAAIIEAYVAGLEKKEGTGL